MLVMSLEKFDLNNVNIAKGQKKTVASSLGMLDSNSNSNSNNLSKKQVMKKLNKSIKKDVIESIVFDASGRDWVSLEIWLMLKKVMVKK